MDDDEWCYEDSDEGCPTGGWLTGQPRFVTCKLCIERFNLRPHHPSIVVPLSKTRADAMEVIRACKEAAARGNMDHGEWSQFFDEATSGDGAHMLATIERWFGVE